MIRLSAFAAALLTAACVPSPEEFETTPVIVQTAKGPVTCQLYSPDYVVWDRAIDRPGSMSVKEGDDICKAEGTRRKSG